MKDNHTRRICVAPMMGYTTPYARKLYRMLSKKTFLFTEMIAAKSMIYSKNRDLIIENQGYNPVALQVGGSEYGDLKKCSKIAYDYNYDEINLNVGCPSKAVQKGSFGACLMKDKKLVRNCLEVMQNNKIQVSMKCRIGLGKELNYDFFEEFIDEISKSGINYIYVHSRNAILNGISPKANRNIPKLDYSFVKRIKEKFPNISFILNGGVDNLYKIESLLNEFDGVMLGRLIQNNPFFLTNVDHKFFGKDKVVVNEDTIVNYFSYIKTKVNNESIFRLLSPILQIFFGVPNSKKFKITANEYMKGGNLNMLEKLFIEYVRNKDFLIN